MSLQSCAMFAAIRNNETNKIEEISVPTNQRKSLLASNNFNYLRPVPPSEMSNMGSEISETISGYLGGSSDAFDAAMGKFALAYADQAERDHAALKDAVKNGRIAASEES